MLRFWRRKPSGLDAPIKAVLENMKANGPDTEEFESNVDYLERLMALKAGEGRRHISPDTLLIVAGNLLGILVIVAYEQKHVMVSKALGFVNRSEARIH